VNTAAFLSKLASNRNKSLIFEFSGEKINKGYHVTEFKAINVNSMDCGSNTNAWNETVLHITAPKQAAPTSEYMSAQKFLELYKIVAGKIVNDDNAIVRVEYAAKDGVAVNYLVDDIEINEKSIIIKSLAPGTACKAVDYLKGNIPLATVAIDDDICCC